MNHGAKEEHTSIMGKMALYIIVDSDVNDQRQVMKMKVKDTLLCADKEDAKNCIDNIESQWIDDWQFLDGGKVRLFLKDGWKGKTDESERISYSG